VSPFRKGKNWNSAEGISTVDLRIGYDDNEDEFSCQDWVKDYSADSYRFATR
jgi:hypothetical protein